MLDDKRAEEAGEEAGGGVAGSGGRLSAHEQRVARVAQRARRLEEENMGEKDWFMRGETKSGADRSSFHRSSGGFGREWLEGVSSNRQSSSKAALIAHSYSFSCIFGRIRVSWISPGSFHAL